MICERAKIVKNRLENIFKSYNYREHTYGCWKQQKNLNWMRLIYSMWFSVKPINMVIEFYSKKDFDVWTIRFYFFELVPNERIFIRVNEQLVYENNR